MKIGNTVKVIKGTNVPVGSVGTIISISDKFYYRVGRGDTTQCVIKCGDKLYTTYICNLQKISNKFWVVWNESTGKINFKHSSKEEAQKEAERLANKNPNTSFYVLESVSVSTTNKVITKEII